MSDIDTPRNCSYNENKAEIDGDNYAITFDHNDGTIKVWSRGAMVSSFRNLSIYDYFLRFYPSIHEAYQEFSRQVIQKHLDAYKDHVRLHRFRGDQYRFEITVDDTRYFEEDIMTRGTLQDN